MNSTAIPSPAAGDVIFTGAAKMELLFSWAAQLLIDPAARRSPSSFGHVAIACDEDLALESVPAPENGQGEKGAWSQVDLGFGVRPILIADILIGAKRAGHRFHVLRAEDPPSNLKQALARDSKFLEGVIGSQYSIDALKESAEAKLNRPIPAALEGYLDWSAKATNLQARAELTAEHVKQLAEIMPEYAEHLSSQSYFCSQFVRELLVRTKLVNAVEIEPRITPTGLYARLLEIGWQDVTETDYASDAVRNLALDRSGAAGAHFITMHGIDEMNLRMHALAMQVRVIEHSMNRMNELLDEHNKTLTKISGGTSPE